MTFLIIALFAIIVIALGFCGVYLAAISRTMTTTAGTVFTLVGGIIFLTLVVVAIALFARIIGAQ